MELLSNIRLLSIPMWVKVAIWILLLMALAFNIKIGMSALQAQSVSDVEAAAGLFSITFPIFLLALILSSIKAGQKALKQRTQEVLQQDIPRALTGITEGTRPFRHHKDKSKNTRENEADVWLNYVKDTFLSDYAIRTQTKLEHQVLLNLRVEINVKRANVGIMLNLHALNNEIKKISSDEIKHAPKLSFEDISRIFPHSISASTGAADNENGNDFYQYNFNRELSPAFSCFSPDDHSMSAHEFVMLVASVRLPPAFLWDPSERLFFSQDLTLLLRSMINEKPHLFETTSNAD